MDVGQRRQLGQVVQTEEFQELGSRAVHPRPTGHVLATHLADQLLGQQRVDDAINGDPTHRLDLQLGNGLTVGNNGQSLQGRPAQSAGFFLQQRLDVLGVLRRGAELVAASHLGKDNTPVCGPVFFAQQRQGRFHFRRCHADDF